MWSLGIGLAVSIGSRLMGHEINFEETLLIILIVIVISFEQDREKRETREKNQS